MNFIGQLRNDKEHYTQGELFQLEGVEYVLMCITLDLCHHYTRDYNSLLFEAVVSCSAFYSYKIEKQKPGQAF